MGRDHVARRIFHQKENKPDDVAKTINTCTESKKLPGDGRPLLKHVGACILNKGVVKFSACVGCFCYV
jgi:hypothetical protein